MGIPAGPNRRVRGLSTGLINILVTDSGSAAAVLGLDARSA